MKESPNGKPSIISPGVSESVTSPASILSFVSNQLTGAEPDAACVDHLTNLGSSIVRD